MDLNIKRLSNRNLLISIQFQLEVLRCILNQQSRSQEHILIMSMKIIIQESLVNIKEIKQSPKIIIIVDYKAYSSCIKQHEKQNNIRQKSLETYLLFMSLIYIHKCFVADVYTQLIRTRGEQKGLPRFAFSLTSMDNKEKMYIIIYCQKAASPLVTFGQQQNSVSHKLCYNWSVLNRTKNQPIRGVGLDDCFKTEIINLSHMNELKKGWFVVYETEF